MRTPFAVAAAVAALLATAATAAAAPSVVIRRTEHGIPHIKARTFEGIGYGYGYAFAQDNLCEMAETYVTVNAERSRFFGPDATYSSRGNGTTPNNLNSDFFFQRIKDDHVVEQLVAQPPPNGPLPEVRQGVRGYVEGYNAYLRDTGVNHLPDPRCRGKAWVRPITEMDAYRRFYQLALLASAGVAIDGIGSAQPPTPGAPIPPVTLPLPGLPGLPGLGRHLLGDLGSNAIALGRAATDNHRGMVLGNPHFPWDGPERFYEAQLTIPGKVDVSGASLYGVPLVLIGHTRNLAWSHTVSTAYRFTPFELKLVPGSPTTYLVDGRPHEMQRRQVTVQTLKPDGTLEPRTRTLYSTEYGPILTSLAGEPLFPWTPVTAYAMGDANASNFRLLNHFLLTDQAQSTHQLDAIERRYQGIPWVNTIAADSAGNAYYADIGTVPHVTDALARSCDTALGAATFAAIGLPVLDGSRSACRWPDDPGAAAPGIFAPSHQPSLFRDDYVTNSNDSYWLSNPAHPLEGFDRIIGDERTERSLRTRLGLKIVAGRLRRVPFTLNALRRAVFNDRQHAGELMRDDLVTYCRTQPDLAAACDVLAHWDLHDNLDSKGAVLFRRFATRLLRAGGAAGTPPGIWRVPFDPKDPVNTPRSLNTGNPLVGQALRGAIDDVNGLGKGLGVTLRQVQYEQRGGERIPIHGGPGDPEGDFNAINVQWVAGQGYPDVPHGSSFVMASQLTGGCPRTRTILTYSLSTNPASPWFADQTRMFSRKQWVSERFCEKQIRAARDLRITQFGARRCMARRALIRRLPLLRGERLRRVRVKRARAGWVHVVAHTSRHRTIRLDRRATLSRCR